MIYYVFFLYFLQSFFFIFMLLPVVRTTEQNYTFCRENLIFIFDLCKTTIMTLFFNTF